MRSTLFAVVALPLVAVVASAGPIYTPVPKSNPLAGLPMNLPSPLNGPLAGRGVTLPSPVSPSVHLPLPVLPAPAIAPAPAALPAPAAAPEAFEQMILPGVSIPATVVARFGESKGNAPAPAPESDPLRQIFDGGPSRKHAPSWEPVLPGIAPSRRHGLPEDELERELGL